MNLITAVSCHDEKQRRRESIRNLWNSVGFIVFSGIWTFSTFRLVTIRQKHAINHGKHYIKMVDIQTL